MRSQKMGFKNDLKFVSKLLFLVSNFLREREKKASDKLLLYH
jgi:hypothetical protein